MVHGIWFVNRQGINRLELFRLELLELLEKLVLGPGFAEELPKMGEELKRLISFRGAYRGHGTRAVKAANEVINSYSPDLDALEDVFEGLCSSMKQLLLQNQKIELAVSEDKTEEEISQTLEYTDDLTGKILCKIPSSCESSN